MTFNLKAQKVVLQHNIFYLFTFTSGKFWFIVLVFPKLKTFCKAESNLHMPEHILHFTLSTMHRCWCCFFKYAAGIFRDLKENLWGGYLKEILLFQQYFTESHILVCNSQQWFVMAVCESWMQLDTVSGSWREQCSSVGRRKEC